MSDDREVVESVDVLIPAPGSNLSGTLYTPLDGADIHSGLVLATGRGGQRGWWHWLAVMLATAGYVTLTFDFRSPADNGEPAGAELLADMEAAVAYLDALPGIDRSELLVGGQGLGGSLALQVAANKPSVKAVFGFGVDSGGAEIQRVMPEVKVPLLLVQYTHDQLVPLHVVEELYSLAGGPKRLVVAEGGSHQAAYRDPQIAVLLLDWFRDLQQAQLLQLLWVPPEVLASE